MTEREAPRGAVEVQVEPCMDGGWDMNVRSDTEEWDGWIGVDDEHEARAAAQRIARALEQPLPDPPGPDPAAEGTTDELAKDVDGLSCD